MSNLSSNSAFRQTMMVQSFQQSYDAFQRLQIQIDKSFGTTMLSQNVEDNTYNINLIFKKSIHAEK
jgi:hypothetical protein